ncbi:MAG: helix-turn-helix domain-containing protein [Methylocella sp.]
MDDISQQRLLTTDEAAELLHVSPRFVRQRVQTGELPSVRLGRLHRLHRDVIEEFMRFGQVAETQRWRRPRTGE